jgi:hypothetical protein
MSVAVAAYATKIPLISLALQVLICMSAWNNSTPTRQIFWNFILWIL